MAHPPKTTGDPFQIVREVGLEWADVAATTKYDGSPRLTVGGTFMAGLARHPSAEPGTLDTYYLTDYYRSYPLILHKNESSEHANLTVDQLSGNFCLPKFIKRSRFKLIREFYQLDLDLLRYTACSKKFG